MNQPAVDHGIRRVACAGAVPAIQTGADMVLRSQDGVVLGRISSVVVEDGADEVQFAVVCFASVSRLGEDARVVPWALVETQGNDCIVHLPADAIRSAPIFVAGTCCGDPGFWHRVEDHFRRCA
ncbi:hypothetical protein [uncultured Alsobacter sp.]|uniref:hypothetical protein n=1 Tax=uncultured Alsobacter sp. TaxID=1748258 RepID=UPI0025F83D2B|nr:hypothetical protein [uncultured Alsobacter sp.]